MIHCLYKTINTVNNKFYIGVHSTDDTNFGTPLSNDKYLGSGNLLKLAIAKYGKEHFKVHRLSVYDTKQAAYTAEKQLLTEQWLFENKGICYNLGIGGYGGDQISINPKEIVKRRKRLINKHKHDTEYHKKVMSGLTNKEARGKQKKSLKVWWSQENRRELRSFEMKQECNQRIKNLKMLEKAHKDFLKQTNSHEILVKAAKQKFINNPALYEKYSKLGKLRKFTRTVCPHCGKCGGEVVMHRYHLDRCKQNVN